jgi:hypothetical protein
MRRDRMGRRIAGGGAGNAGGEAWGGNGKLQAQSRGLCIVMRRMLAPWTVALGAVERVVGKKEPRTASRGLGR